MAGDWRTFSVALKADASGYTTSLAQASLATKDFSSQSQTSTSTVGRSWTTMGSLMQGVAAGMGIGLSRMVADAARWVVGMVDSSLQFQKTMLNVESLGGETASSIHSMSQSVIAMSETLPQSANTLAEGLYDIESSGFSGAAALEVLGASAKAASAGLSDTATSARAITGVLNAYGLSADHAREVSDILFQTVNVGVITFPELAQNLGDVVPMAAAMGVSLKEATGALATMTLAGLPAAEAATATARVMQSFIKPSQGMATELARLGVTLDDLGPHGEGMSKVMLRIAKDTGGSTVALQQMFPDVRALKGALALTSAEGANYARVMNAQADATTGAGATQRAFATQMEGLSAQWALLSNRVHAVFLNLSVEMIPVVQHAASAFGGLLSDAVSHLSGVWNNLVSAGADLIHVLGEVWNGAEPVVRVFGTLAGGAVLGTLTALSAALSGIGGFLAHNEGLVRAVGLAFAAWGAVQIITGVGTALTAAGGLLDGIKLKGMYAGDALRNGFGTAEAAVGSLKAALATALPVAAIMAVTSAIQGLENASKKAKASVDSINDSAAGKGLDGLRIAANESADATQHLDGTINTHQGWLGQLGRVTQSTVQLMTPFKNTVADSTAKLKAQQENAKALTDQYHLMASTASDLAIQYGLTVPQVEKLLTSDKKLNLTNATQTEVQASFAKSLDATAKKLGVTQDAVGGMNYALTQSGMSVDDFSKSLQDAQDKASQAILTFGDLSTHNFQLKPDQILNVGDITKFYSDTVAQTQTFSSQVSALIQQGYDPGLVSRLMQQGPEKAGPVVNALVQGYSQNLVNLVNTAEQQISQVSAKAAEQARLTQMAINAPTSRLTSELPQAQAISEMSSTGMNDVQIALKLGIDPKSVDKVASDFGITINKVQRQADGKPVAVGATTKGIDEAFDAITTKLGSLASGKRFKLKGTDLLDLASLLGTVGTADGVLAKLTQERKIKLSTPGVPKYEIDQLDAQISAVTQARDVLVHPKADPASVAVVNSQIMILASARDTMVKAHADPSAIAQVDRQINNLTLTRNAIVNAQPDTAGAENAIDTTARDRNSTVHVGADTSAAAAAIASVTASMNAVTSIFGFHLHSRGGIEHFAAGGLTAGGIANRPMWAWAEPQTGGEAFIPRLGISQSRAASILDTAAAWHGMSVSKGKAAPYTPAASTTMNVNFGGLTVNASNAGTPQQVGSAVKQAISEWVDRNPDRIAASVGRASARNGRQ